MNICEKFLCFCSFPLSPWLLSQILRDVPKARREVDLHWRVAAHENIVNLIDIYENVYLGQRSLLVVMEWCVGSVGWDSLSCFISKCSSAGRALC